MNLKSEQNFLYRHRETHLPYPLPQPPPLGPALRFLKKNLMGEHVNQKFSSHRTFPSRKLSEVFFTFTYDSDEKPPAFWRENT